MYEVLFLTLILYKFITEIWLDCAQSVQYSEDCDGKKMVLMLMPKNLTNCTRLWTWSYGKPTTFYLFLFSYQNEYHRRLNQSQINSKYFREGRPYKIWPNTLHMTPLKTAALQVCRVYDSVAKTPIHTELDVCT